MRLRPIEEGNFRDISLHPEKGFNLVIVKDLVFFSLVGYLSRTSADDFIIRQRQAICQIFWSYPPSGKFCTVSEFLNYPDKKVAAGEKGLFGQTWVILQ